MKKGENGGRRHGCRVKPSLTTLVKWNGVHNYYAHEDMQVDLDSVFDMWNGSQERATEAYVYGLNDLIQFIKEEDEKYGN